LHKKVFSKHKEALLAFAKITKLTHTLPSSSFILFECCSFRGDDIDSLKYLCEIHMENTEKILGILYRVTDHRYACSKKMTWAACNLTVRKPPSI
jgi:hypothetical protein